VDEGTPQDKAIEEAFIKTDDWLRSLDSSESSGSTVVCGAYRRVGDEYEALIANAGDSRGLLVRQAVATSQTIASDDHKPNRPDEMERIYAAGGCVSAAGPVARVDGNLAVSRGLGDFSYKQVGKPAKEHKVSCIPEMYRATLQPNDLIILACDGVFDVMSNDELVDLVQKQIKEHGPTALPEVAAHILRHCLTLDSKDNMTLMLIQVGVDGSEWEGTPDEIYDLNLIKTESDDSVKQQYREFLKYCALSGPLPADAQAVLEESPPAAEQGGSSRAASIADEILRFRDRFDIIETRQHAVDEEKSPSTP
jgi:serine/threonine protein phosphatase PrpC